MALRRNRPILYEVAAAKKRRAGWGLLSNRQAEDEKEPRPDKSPAAEERPAAPPPPQAASEPRKIQPSAPAPSTAPVVSEAPAPVIAPAHTSATPAQTSTPAIAPAPAPAPAPVVRPTPQTPVVTRAASETPPQPTTTLFQPAPVAVERAHTIPPTHAYHVEEGRPSRRTFDLSQVVILGSILIAVTALAWIATMRSGSGEKNVVEGPPAVTDGESIQARDLITIPERTAQRPTSAEPARPADRSSPPTAELPAGHHYVVVQHFPTRRADHAEAAARYLIENGVPCALETGTDIRLLVTTPFLIDQADTRAAAAQRQEAERLVLRVKALGQEYFRIGGYNFAGATLQKR